MENDPAKNLSGSSDVAFRLFNPMVEKIADSDEAIYSKLSDEPFHSKQVKLGFFTYAWIHWEADFEI